MSGVPGKGGPVPKRSDQRRRRNKPDVEVAQAPGAANVSVPHPEPDWHPIARDWFVSLAESGQARFYEPSDWQTARYVSEAMSRNLSGEKFSAVLFASVMSGMSSLLTTEGDRRRLRLELERAAAVDADEDAAVAKLDEYRARFSG